MYAVIEDRGKQYKVKKGDAIQIDLMEAAEGQPLDFDRVLMVGDAGERNAIGTPHIAGAKITAKVLGEGKGPKIRIFKLRRRKNSRRRAGHRQRYTRIRIENIILP